MNLMGSPDVKDRVDIQRLERAGRSQCLTLVANK